MSFLNRQAVDHPFLVEHNVEKGVSNSEPTVKGFRSSSILNKIHLNDFRTSTKIEALVCNYILCYHHMYSPQFAFLLCLACFFPFHKERKEMKCGLCIKYISHFKSEMNEGLVCSTL